MSSKAQTKKPTPATHPQHLYYQKYKMVQFNGRMEKTEVKECVTSPDQFDTLRDMDAFRGWGIEVTHDPRTAKPKTRTRKAKEATKETKETPKKDD